MKALESSLSYRATRRAGTWLLSVGRGSYVGQFFVSLAGGSRKAFGGSEVFGLGRIDSRRLQRTGHSLSILAISRPYLWLRGSVGDAAARVPVRGSRWFGHGEWLRVVGAGVFALGLGRLASIAVRGVTVDQAGLPLAAPGLRLVPIILLTLIGALVFAAGPRLLPAVRMSIAGRGARWVGYEVVEGRAPPASRGVPLSKDHALSPPPSVERLRTSESRLASAWRRLSVPLTVAVVLAAVAGLIGGLTTDSGPLLLVAFVVAIFVLALILGRPEVMLLLVALFPWLDYAARRSLGGLGPVWDDALLIFSVGVLLWCVVVLRRSTLWTVPIALPALLAFVAALGSVVVNDVPGDVALFAVRVLFEPLLFYFLGFLFPKSRRLLQWTVALFLLAGLALALHGLYQYATHAPMPARWVDLREVGAISTRAYSIIGNPNGLGAFLLLGFLLSLSLALTRGLGKVRRSAVAIVGAVHLAGVAVTFSRGAWLGLGAGVLALIIMAHRRFIVPLLAAGVLAWFAVPRQFVDRLAFGFSSAYISKSLTAGRLYVWRIALGDIAAHPFFGVGLGTFGGTSAVLFGYSRLWVDNFYLQLAAEGGLILLVLFLWILVRGAKALFKGYTLSSDPFMRSLTAGVFGGWVAVAVANFTASVWETLVVGVGFWFLGGLAASAALHAADVEVPATRSEKDFADESLGDRSGDLRKEGA